MMNRRLALVSGLAILSAVAFAPKAGAAPATEEVEFGGNIVGVCTFTGTSNGSLGQYSPSAPFVEASQDTTIGGTGTAGTTTVNCTSGGQVTVAAPVKLAAPATFTDTSRQAIVYDAIANAKTSATVGAPIWESGMPTTALTIPANTDRTLKVGMNAGVPGTTGGVPVGTYTYTVTLTATPN